MNPFNDPRRPRAVPRSECIRRLAAFILPILLLLAVPHRSEADPVTQGQWARMLAEAMGLDAAVDPTGKDDAALMEFLSGTLAPPIRVWGVSSKPFPSGATRVPEGAAPERAWVRAGKAPATARYSVRVRNPGIYALRALGAGGPQRWRIGDGEPRLARPTGGPESIAKGEGEPDLVGYFVLAAGEHAVSVEVPPDGVLQRFDLVRQPFPHVRPPGGWRAGAPLTYGDKAVTMIQAMQLEHELPDVSRWRVQREGERYDAEPRPALQTNQGTEEKPSAGLLIKGADDGSRVLYRLAVPREGTYTLLARVTGSAGGRMLMNEAVERAWAAPRHADRLVWNDLATLPISGGDQEFDVRLDAGAGLDVLRLVYRDPSPEAALALLADLGFNESAADEPVSMAAAFENLEDTRFLERVNSLVAGFFSQPGAGIGPAPGPLSAEPTGLVLPEEPLPPEPTNISP